MTLQHIIEQAYARGVTGPRGIQHFAEQLGHSVNYDSLRQTMYWMRKYPERYRKKVTTVPKKTYHKRKQHYHQFILRCFAQGITKPNDIHRLAKGWIPIGRIVNTIAYLKRLGQLSSKCPATTQPSIEPYASRCRAVN